MAQSIPKCWMKMQDEYCIICRADVTVTNYRKRNRSNKNLLIYTAVMTAWRWKCTRILFIRYKYPLHNMGSPKEQAVEWFGLQGTLKGFLQPLWNVLGYLPLYQTSHNPIQHDLECFQGWGIYHLSGQPIPVFPHFHHKNFLSYI